MRVIISKYITIQILSLAAITSCIAQTDFEIPEDSLPIATYRELHTKYANYNVNSIIREVDKKQVETYKVEIQKNTRLIRFQYDSKGKLICKQKDRVFTYDGTDLVKRPDDKS